MEAEAADAGVGEVSGDWQEFGDGRHVAVEGGVETGDLRAGGEGFGEGVDQGDLAGEMGDVERLGLTKRGHHLGCDEAVLV